MSINVSGNIISSTGFTTSSEIVNTPTIVTDGLVLWLDAGNIASYNNSASYYDCGYGCQYYASSPGCTNCNTQIKDMSGYGNDGTFYDGASVLYSDAGGYVNFDYTNDSIKGFGNFGSPTTFTLSAWVNSTNIALDQNIFNANGPVFLRITSSTIRCNVYTGTWIFVNGSITLSSNTWYNLVLTYDQSFVKGYVNGVLDINSAKTGVPQWGSLQSIGYTTGGEDAPGVSKLAVAQIYNRAITSDEVIQNFNADRQRFGI